MVLAPTGIDRRDEQANFSDSARKAVLSANTF